jgi:hypothetical protein
LDRIDKAATTKKAMPVQKRSPPVRKYTTTATRIAGIRTRNSLMRITIIKPIMTRMMRKVMSNPEGSPKLLRTE